MSMTPRQINRILLIFIARTVVTLILLGLTLGIEMLRGQAHQFLVNWLLLESGLAIAVGVWSFEVWRRTRAVYKGGGRT